MQYNELRKQYATFTYAGYAVTERAGEIEIVYEFSIDNLAAFTPRWVIPKPDDKPLRTDGVINELIFMLGMAELISYWKAACPPVVRVLPRQLNAEAQAFWKKLYFHGLGEFFYVSGIATDIDSFIRFDCQGAPEKERATSDKKLKGALIPVGGGKDSIVTLELLRGKHAHNAAFMINHRPSSAEAIALAKVPQTICPKRTLDNRLLELNRQGFLNGHTPFSSVVAFAAVLCAYIWGLQDVVLSNESSANEPTVPGTDINHQYSKSIEFERDFASYIETQTGSGVRYFSLLRPLSEYQIAALFARHRAYYPVFRSCNRGSKNDSWCGKCPKCLFVYIILSPFLNSKQLHGIFGRDLLANETLLPTLWELVGESNIKPFECVGSRDEINFALCETIAKAKDKDALPALLAAYTKSRSYTKYKRRRNPYAKYEDRNNRVPPEYRALLDKALKGLAHE